MTELEMFDRRAGATVAGWAGTPEESQVWCSLDDVTADTVIAWSEQAGVEAFMHVDGEHPVGYGEIWVDPAENEVELAHLIVEPAARRRGIGRALVAGLVEQARNHYPVVSLRVHSRNEVAIRCYASAGFVRASATDEAEWNVGQPVAYVWMTHRSAKSSV